MPGTAFDLTTTDAKGEPWDFNIERKRQEAWRIVREEKPMVLIGTPMCTKFSAWAKLCNARWGRDPALVAREYRNAMVHLRFCCELYQYQIDQGRYFVRGHSMLANSWNEACVQRLLS